VKNDEERVKNDQRTTKCKTRGGFDGDRYIVQSYTVQLLLKTTIMVVVKYSFNGSSNGSIRSK
jgi:hypothetical protein